MALGEAIHLLRAGLPDDSIGDFESLAAHLGEWPLLLKLVTGQLKEMVANSGLSIPEALKEIQDALAIEGFSAFNKDDSDSRHAAASRAILVSVQRLPEKEKDLFLQLAVFPEDEDVPVSVLERYWHLPRLTVCAPIRPPPAGVWIFLGSPTWGCHPRLDNGRPSGFRHFAAGLPILAI